jgi:hypothetical protein
MDVSYYLKEHLPISLGSDVKSRRGTGIFLIIYSQITSILYLSWADIGIMGAPSAMVPERNFQNCKNFLDTPCFKCKNQS